MSLGIDVEMPVEGHGAPSVADRALAWGGTTGSSARSVLATIFGDTVAPLGGTVWLADLFCLAEPFGFNERLVRTSMSRLAGEGWVVSERVGRRSRYSLTPFGRDSFAEADARIYQAAGSSAADRSWDGRWTLVFLPAGEQSDDGHRELVRHLRWRGFAALDRTVYAAPAAEVEQTRQLVEHLAITFEPLIASATFDDVAPLSSSGPFRDGSGLTAAEETYGEFVARYRWLEAAPLADVDGVEAFALRTMLVHDLRRARLRDPDLPTEVLGPDWVGHRARQLAAAAYPVLADPSWRWVDGATELSIESLRPPHTTRFAPQEAP